MLVEPKHNLFKPCKQPVGLFVLDNDQWVISKLYKSKSGCTNSLKKDLSGRGIYRGSIYEYCKCRDNIHPYWDVDQLIKIQSLKDNNVLFQGKLCEFKNCGK